MVQCFWVSTYVRRRPVFYSLDAGFFFYWNFCSYTQYNSNKNKSRDKICPNIDKSVPSEYNYNCGGGLYEKEKHYQFDSVSC